MSTRPLFTGQPTIEVDLSRYEELCHKEARLMAVGAYVRHVKYPDQDTLLIIAGEEVQDEQ